MSYLFKWQSISLVSRILAMSLGIVQSLVIVNVLTPGDWGTIRIVASIASFIGVSQAVGLTSGSTREISSAKDKNQAFKVFLVALSIRLLISFPFVIILFFAAPILASNRDNSEIIVWALRIIALVLLMQSTQGIFNSVLSGFKQFKTLFTYQVYIALISVLTYVPLVYFFQFQGYYYSYVLFNILATATLCILALKNFTKPLPKLLWSDIKEITKDIFGISMVVYFVKLLHTLWLESPILYLNYFIGSDEVVIAVFGFALFYSTKLMVFSDSVTDVTLPVMSKKFTSNLDEFKSSYSINFKKTFVIITFVAALASYWNREVITFVVRRPEYVSSTFIVPLTMLAVWAYSQINLYKSSVFVPAKKLFSLFLTYAFMIIGVYTFVFILNQFNYLSTGVNLALGFGLGTLLALLISTLLIKRDLNLLLIGKWEVTYFLITALYVLSYYLIPDIILKVVVTLVYFLLSLYFFNKNGLVKLFYGYINK